ncbi:F0F1 ATP synthase subunit delta [Bacillus amyloliquefaciens]|nr:F0F1 ATP synthase subunit delta [Bacillus amyloliquefaciens]
MSGSAVSKRYASALFDIAVETSQINEIEEELTVLKKCSETKPDYRKC